MKLDISELIKNKSTEINFDESYDRATLERDEFIIRLKSPIVITGRAINEGDIIQISGGFSCSIVAECSRCLEEFEYMLNVDFDENFSKSVEDEDEYYPIVDGNIIFDDMVMDYIILSMPVRFICNEECKGLCHECGANLNKVDCDCEKDTINPKFAALKDLFKQDEEV